VASLSEADAELWRARRGELHRALERRLGRPVTGKRRGDRARLRSLDRGAAADLLRGELPALARGSASDRAGLTRAAEALR
jgi:hypothetical protein